MVSRPDSFVSKEFSTVHLVVDMQKRYVRTLKPEEGAALVDGLEKFIDATHASIPPLYIKTVDEDMFWAEGEALDGYSFAFNRKAFHPALTAYDSVQEKTFSSPFKYGRNALVPLDASAMHKKLQDMGAQTVLVSGLYEYLCVWETARDAATLGYDVVILKDLCRGNGRVTEFSKERALQIEEFCAAHPNIRFGTSDEFSPGAPPLRAAPHSRPVLGI